MAINDAKILKRRKGRKPNRTKKEWNLDKDNSPRGDIDPRHQEILEYIPGLDFNKRQVEAVGDTATTMANAYFAPDSIKQGNNSTGDLLSKGLDVIYYVDRVTNIEEIGKLYETFGYKVDRVVNGNPITFNRILYNYVECSDIDLEINLLSSDDIVNDLHVRFINGLRLWNTNKMNELNINLGDVCVYDNTETYEEVTNE